MNADSDWYAVVGLEIVLFLLVIVSMVMAVIVRRSRGIGINVMRGPQSWQRFGLRYGFANVIVLQLINASEAFNGHKVLRM